MAKTTRVVLHNEKKLLQEIEAGSHHLQSDGAVVLGGDSSAPSPHELLASALGACTSMTLRLYADRKKWDLQRIRVEVEEVTENTVTTFFRKIGLYGNLSSDEQQQLLAIADKCPIHKILSRANSIQTTLMPA